MERAVDISHRDAATIRVMCVGGNKKVHAVEKLNFKSVG
jgi:hypothetical protein